MIPSPIPWKVLSSQLGVGVLTEGWNLDVADTTAGEESRCFRVEIAFAAPFLAVPVVQLGLTGLDVDQRDSARVSLKATHITEIGFQAEVWTWAGSRVYAIEFNWFAIGA
jgi:hypothetical protein